MKKALIILVFSMALGVWSASYIASDPGYVLIAFKNTTVETSLWVGIVLLVAVLFIVNLVFWLMLRLFGTSEAVRNWSTNYKHRRSARKTTSGMIDLVEGNWSSAQKKLGKAAAKSDTPLLNYLAAARAAAENEDDQSSEYFLRLADESTPGADLAVGIAKAEIQMQRGQYEQALASLIQLSKSNPKHQHVHKLLQQVYLRLEDWQALNQLIPTLRKLKVAPSDELDEIEQKALLALLQRAANAMPGEHVNGDRAVRVREIWLQAHAKVRRRKKMTLAYLNCLEAAGKSQWSEMALREAIEAEWDDTLINRYGLVAGKDLQRQLLTAESWLKERTNNAALMLTLGRLSLMNKLWGKAREYFTASIKIKKTPEACAELGRLLLQLGDADASRRVIEQGFDLIIDDLPDLPLPQKKLANLGSLADS